MYPLSHQHYNFTRRNSSSVRAFRVSNFTREGGDKKGKELEKEFATMRGQWHTGIYYRQLFISITL